MWILRKLLGVAVFALPTAVAVAENYAIVVGVNDCPNFHMPDGSKPRPLRGAEVDADGMADLLIQNYGFAEGNVLKIKGPRATRERIKQSFAEFAKKVRPGDVFVVHFSGYGTQIPDQRPFDEPDDLDEALCPCDANERGENLIVDDELGVWLDDIPAKQVTVILDCCHAGTGTKDPDDDLQPRYLPIRIAERRPADSKKQSWRELRSSTKSLDRRMHAFFACQAGQQAYERRILEAKPPVRAGQFTHYFLEGLRTQEADASHDGIITNKEMVDYVARRLDEDFNRTRSSPSDRQQPAMETDSGYAPVFLNPIAKCEEGTDEMIKTQRAKLQKIALRRFAAKR